MSIAEIGCFLHIQLYMCKIVRHILTKTEAAPGEARTHGLQIMRLTRCLLRYRGYSTEVAKILNDLRKSSWQNSITLCSETHHHHFLTKIYEKQWLPTGGLEPPIFGLGDRRLIH